MEVNVLYEDNHLIAVLKPAGVLVQGDETGERSLMDDVKDYIKEKYNKPGNVFLGLVHRLDRNVSGIVLFAKTSKGASRISEQFRTHKVEKIYHAWVEGEVKVKNAVLVNYLLKDERINKTKVFEEAMPGADYAELSYEVVEVKEKGGHVHSLLKIILKTGRSHQIRAQLSYLGHPIVGDAKYGAHTTFPDKHIALKATSLTFTMATGDEKKVIEIEPPEL